VKILTNVRDQLAIRRVVGRLGFVLLCVAEKAKLRHGRSNDENLISSRERARDGLEEPVLVVRMVVGSRLLILRMPMHMVVGRMHGGLVEGRGIDMKDLGLLTVHPHRHLSHDVVLAQTIQVRPCGSCIRWDMTTHREKSDDLLKAVEMGNGRRAEIIGTAVVGVVALIGLLIVGFRGRQIGRNSAALTMPLEGQVRSEAPHPTGVRPQ
jgi:hypothetical protein